MTAVQLDTPVPARAPGPAPVRLLAGVASHEPVPVNPGRGQALAPNACACDEAGCVHDVLSCRLSALVPGPDGVTLGPRSAETLAQWAAGEAARVLSAAAEVVNEMPEPPGELVLFLRGTAAVPIANPLRRLSALFTPEDVLLLAAAADNGVLLTLLEDGTVQQREAALDVLAARTAAGPDRAVLSGGSACLVRWLIAGELVAMLGASAGLPTRHLDDFGIRLRARLDGAEGLPAAQEIADAQALGRRGALDEAAVLGPAREGQVVRAGVRLAVAAGLPCAAVERAVALRSAKALVSLAWKAGLSMRAALTVQAVLGELGPGELLHPGPDGAFPLPADEMRFHLELIARGS